MGLGELYRQQLKTSLAAMLQYRAALGIWLIGNLLEPLVLLSVWTAVSASGGGSVGGFSAGDFAAYYICLMLVNQLTYTWIMYEFEYRVRHGSLSFALLRPVHPIHSDIADNLSSKLVSLPVMLVVAGILALTFKPAFHVAPWEVVLFFPALAMAFLVRFLIEWTLALAAFWTTRTNAINQVYFVVMLFLSGQIAPLPLLPLPVRTVATVLPFRWIISFPVELLLGGLSPLQTLTGFAAQAAWAAAGFLLVRLAWRAGVKLYSGVGA